MIRKKIAYLDAHSNDYAKTNILINYEYKNARE